MVFGGVRCVVGGAGGGQRLFLLARLREKRKKERMDETKDRTRTV